MLETCNTQSIPTGSVVASEKLLRYMQASLLSFATVCLDLHETNGGISSDLPSRGRKQTFRSIVIYCAKRFVNEDATENSSFIMLLSKQELSKRPRNTTAERSNNANNKQFPQGLGTHISFRHQVLISLDTQGIKPRTWRLADDQYPCDRCDGIIMSSVVRAESNALK